MAFQSAKGECSALMNGTKVLLTAIGYVSFLFLIACGDGAGRRFLSGRSRAFVYALRVNFRLARK
jgi:hypothetical protein